MDGDAILADPSGHLHVATGRVVVETRTSLAPAPLRAVLDRSDLRLVRRLCPCGRLVLADVKEGVSAESAAASAASRAPIRAAEPETRRAGTPAAGSARARDPLFALSWHLGRVRAPHAWFVTTGKGSRVAVIDEGFFPDHEDLAPNVDGTCSGSWVHNGNLLTFASGLQGMPADGHGTQVAGIVAGAMNGLGGMGVAPHAQLVLLAVESLDVTGVAEAICYAAAPHSAGQGLLAPSWGFTPGAGADVIVCPFSFEDGPLPLSLTHALEEAGTSRGHACKGVPIFVSAPTDAAASIDANAFASHPNVVSVGATKADDTPAIAYRTGATLGLVEPGAGIVGPATIGAGSPPIQNYASNTGTSFAAPIAAGIAALVLSVAPLLGAKQVRQVLAESCEFVGPDPYVLQNDLTGRNDTFGNGLLMASLAVLHALAPGGGLPQTRVIPRLGRRPDFLGPVAWRARQREARPSGPA